MRASDIRKGQAVIMDGKLFVVTNADHNTPGNLRAKVQFKLRDVLKGTIMDKRVGATDDIETTNLDSRQVEYLYSDNEGHVLMDLETYDQIHVPAETVGGGADYLLENTEVVVAVHDGTPLYVELPTSVELLVQHTDPGVQGDRATGGTKPAVLETGAEIQVPLFLNTGDRVKVDTRDGRYLGRVSA